jgi:hypothetical protein
MSNTVPPCTPTAPTIDGTSNTPTPVDAVPSFQVVDGTGSGCVLVYSDACAGPDYLQQALAAKGLSYQWFSQDPYGFELALQSECYQTVLIDHSCFTDLSYVWDDVVTAYQHGNRIGVATFDWDGSHDQSGFVSTLLALGGASAAYDVQNQGTIYVWNPAPLFAGMNTTLLSPLAGTYLDEGDGWSYTTAASGWTNAPSEPNANSTLGGNLVLLGFLPDELSSSDGVRLWSNIIDYLMAGVIPVRPTTWGAIKALYRVPSAR